MRPLLVLTIMLIGLNITAPERKDSGVIGDYFHAIARDAEPSLFEIESSLGRADRLPIAAVQLHEGSDQSPEVDEIEPTLASAAESADIDPVRAPAVLMDDLCNALLTAAQQNQLPVPFFANLIWQESKLRDDAVSPVGALGIAQFMPRVAMASGIDNPFDPLQAIPASARLLRALRDQFGNLGFVAAAYNAGAHRVSEWLEDRRRLPRQTRDYVVRVTGRSADAWRKTPPDDSALTFVRHLPCLDLPAFADLQQAQMQEAQTQNPEAQSEKIEAQKTQKPQQPASTPSRALQQIADRRQLRGHSRHEQIRIAARDRPAGKRREDRVSRAPPEKGKSAHGRRSIVAGVRAGRRQA